MFARQARLRPGRAAQPGQGDPDAAALRRVRQDARQEGAAALSRAAALLMSDCHRALDPALQALVERVQQARAARGTLCIRGGGTKDFYGEAPRGEPLDMRALAGISSYEPTELVVTARAGTPLAELEAVLAEQGPVPGLRAAALRAPAAPSAAWSPPACAGRRAPRSARVRDHVLGATLLNGKGELLSFGGQVMKNVAGYDVSRVLAGSLGMLGVICEVSLKVLPRAGGHGHAALRDGPGRARCSSSTNGPAGRCRCMPAPGGTACWCCACRARRPRCARRRSRSAASAIAAASWPPPSGTACATSSDEFFVSARAALDARRHAVAAVAAADRAAAGAGRRRSWSNGAARSAGSCTAAAGRARCATRPPRPAAMPRCSWATTSSAGVFAPLTSAAGPHPPRTEARLRPRRRVQPRPAVPGAVPMTHSGHRREHARVLRARAPLLRARVLQARAPGRPARDGSLAAAGPSPAATCWRSPAAPAGGRRTARATPRPGWPPT